MVMLGSECSPCCAPCACPVGQKLPDAVTVTFSGLTKSAVKVAELLSVSLNSCFGDGAVIGIDAPGGPPDDPGGPIAAVSLEAGGSGYAVLGRTAPTSLSLSGSGGGAEFQVTFATSTDECDRPLWSISSVNVKSGGGGYQNDEQLAVLLGDNEFEASAAEIRIETQPEPPSLTASADSQAEPATFSVTTQQISVDPPRWGVDTVAVVDNAAGFFEGQAVTITAGEGDTVVSPAVAYIWLKHIEPQVEPDYFGGGSGATFSASLEKFTDGGRDYWRVASATVTSPGSGYTSGQNVFFWNNSGFGSTVSASAWAITADSQTGAIVSISRLSAGKFYGLDGTIDKVIVDSPGSYYGRSTVVQSAAVVSGGAYYKEDTSLPAIVSQVSAVIVQPPGGNGAGAQISVEVDGTVGSQTFGQISKVTLEEAGDGYLDWSYNISDCSAVESLNGNSFVIPRYTTTLENLLGVTITSCFGSGALGSVQAPGGGQDSEGFPIESASVLLGGSGYAVKARAEPTGLTLAKQFADDGGVGASLTINLSSEQHDSCGLPYWGIASVSVNDGGYGYSQGQQLKVQVGAGEVASQAATMTLGVIEPNGEIESVNVGLQGRYYKESNSLPGVPSSVNVSVTQSPPSQGAGAIISAVIDTNPSSQTFGQITGLTVDNGGAGYLGWSWDDPAGCRYERCVSPYGNIIVEYRGSNLPPEVLIRPSDQYAPWCDISFYGSSGDAPFACDPMNFTATEVLGGAAVVTGGDAAEVTSCTELFNAESFTIEIEATDAEINRVVLPRERPIAFPQDEPYCYEQGAWWGTKIDSSDARGVFTLSLAGVTHTSTDTFKVYTYEFPDDGCEMVIGEGRRFISLGLSKNTGIYALTVNAVKVLHSIRYNTTSPGDYADCEDGFSCSYFSAPDAPALGYSDYWKTRENSAHIFSPPACGCNPESLNGATSTIVGLSARSSAYPLPCGSADPCFFDITSGGDGGASLTIKRLEIG